MHETVLHGVTNQNERVGRMFWLVVSMRALRALLLRGITQLADVSVVAWGLAILGLVRVFHAWVFAMYLLCDSIG